MDYECSAVMVSQNSKQAAWTRRPIMCLGNAFSADVMIHARERKFVYCSMDTWFAMRLET